MDLHGLPIELEQFVQQEIAKGKYKSSEEVVSAALRLLQAHERKDHNGHRSEDRQGASRSAEGRSAALIPRTPLAQRLWEHRQQIVASGRPLLDWDDLENELRNRRGDSISGEQA